MKNMKLILLPVVTLFLEMLPYGAVLIFASAPTDSVRKTFSYFSLIPFGYANFAPLLTAILTCVILVLAIISIKREKFCKMVFLVSVIATIISLLPLAYGIKCYSVVGGAITFALFLESVVVHTNKAKRVHRREKIAVVHSKDKKKQ